MEATKLATQKNSKACGKTFKPEITNISKMNALNYSKQEIWTHVTKTKFPLYNLHNRYKAILEAQKASPITPRKRTDACWGVTIKKKASDLILVEMTKNWIASSK